MNILYICPEAKQKKEQFCKYRCPHNEPHEPEIRELTGYNRCADERMKGLAHKRCPSCKPVDFFEEGDFEL